MLIIYLSLLETETEKQRFQWLYDHLRHRMYRAALRLLRSEDLPQEAVQESCLKIIKNFSKIFKIRAQKRGTASLYR